MTPPEGGQAYLREQARKNPTAFLALLGKILPTVVDAKVDQTVTHRIDAPEKETREEWFARHAAAATGHAPGKPRLLN
jgi:hypothetical protein